jgi:hypothetical protein
VVEQVGSKTVPKNVSRNASQAGAASQSVKQTFNSASVESPIALRADQAHIFGVVIKTSFGLFVSKSVSRA